ncbi:MAG: hypothetical protein HKN01_03750 [Acidimicrobiia bacterium]|nr:hypothetical protein [Acidimicrobiia bacterium]
MFDYRFPSRASRCDESLSIDDYAVTGIGSGELTVGIGPVPEWSARGAKFYIQVDNIEETLGRIEAAGGRAVMPRTVGPDFGATHILVFTSFLDPAGNEIGLVEPPSRSVASGLDLVGKGSEELVCVLDLILGEDR